MKKLATLFLLLVSSTMLAQVGFTDAFPALPSFSIPVELVASPDGTNRLFVVEKSGRIYVFQNQSGVSTRTLFLDMSTRIVPQNPGTNDERGLLGLAFHPNYAVNRYFYIYYTRDTVIASVGTRMKMTLSRFEANPSNPNEALSTSEVRLLQFVKNQNNSNHNGGKIAFGTDGFLYASIGDGGGGGDPQNNAQNRNNLFGKMLRIDVDGDDFPLDDDRNYRIPATNPFATGGGSPEIFAWGIRNMWRFSFDNVTGRLIGGDVGQNAFEEIDLIENGKNYGWRKYEGNGVFNASDPVPSNPSATFPILTYGRSQGVSITGGHVYRGTAVPSLDGLYLYADYAFGNVWSLNLNTLSNTLLFNTSGINVSGFGVDQNNELYFIGYNNGRIYRFTNSAPPPSGQTVAGIGVWSAMNNGVSGVVRAIAVSGSDVYVGGSFATASGTTVNNIARWNPTSGWSAMGSGVSGNVNAIAISGSDVYVGGSFATASGTTVNNIARWNGTTWNALGVGTDGYVSSIAVNPNNGNIVVGGAFLNAGGATVNNIAQWNGAAWSDLQGGTNNEVRAVAFNASGELFAGGNFTQAGTTPANNIARWNGTTWNTLGVGTDAIVNAIAVMQNGDVVAGGNFTNAGGTSANRLARWTPASGWSSLGSGASSTVIALATNANDVLAAGAFTTVGGMTVNYLARWNSASGWNALGQETNVGASGVMNAIAVNGRTAFAGGNGITIGGISSNYISRCALPDAAATASVGAGDSQPSFAGTSVSINFTGVASAGAVTVQRYDDAPQNPTGIVGNVSAYRFVIDQTGLGSFNATVRFNRTQIPNNGIFNPQTVRVYRRPTPGTGTFSLLTNAFDPTAPDEVRATTNTFSEFAFGGDGDNPLPVELTEFRGRTVERGIELTWKTASERNNAGFVILRSSRSRAQPATPLTEIGSFRFSPELKGNGTTASATSYKFLDGGVETGNTYTYKLRSFDLDGTAHDYAQTVSVEVQEPVQAKIYEYALLQNYPNPFNPITVIPFTMKAAGAATLTIYDMLGRAVSRQTIQARLGRNEYQFEGSELGSGVYIYQLQANGFVQTKKMMLVK